MPFNADIVRSNCNHTVKSIKRFSKKIEIRIGTCITFMVLFSSDAYNFSQSHSGSTWLWLDLRIYRHREISLPMNIIPEILSKSLGYLINKHVWKTILDFKTIKVMDVPFKDPIFLLQLLLEFTVWLYFERIVSALILGTTWLLCTVNHTGW